MYARAQNNLSTVVYITRYHKTLENVHSFMYNRFYYWNRGYFLFDVLFVFGWTNFSCVISFFLLNSILLLFFMMSLIRKNNDLPSKLYVNERNVNTFFLLFGKRSAELFILSNFVLFIVILYVLYCLYICSCITHMLYTICLKCEFKL